jgi:predicted RNA-binding Zn ribbon-like protein
MDRGFDTCLDFLRADAPGSYADLVTWAGRRSLIDPGEERTLTVEGRLRPEAAATALRHAIAARERLALVVAAIAERRDPEAGALDALNRWVAAASAHRRLVPAPEGLRWGWASGSTDLDRVLWPIAQTVSDLLASSHARKLRRCAECRKVFLDSTKNGSRLFCTKRCGDRVKARRYYRRLRP